MKISFFFWKRVVYELLEILWYCLESMQARHEKKIHVMVNL